LTKSQRRVLNLSYAFVDESDEEVFLVYMSVAFVTRLRREARSIGIEVVAAVSEVCDGDTRFLLSPSKFAALNDSDVMTADILCRR
jgi:hypothetical protein